jgi:hypothetical protein
VSDAACLAGGQMTTIEEQIAQMRENLKQLEAGTFRYTDAAGNLDHQMQADQIAKIKHVLLAYDDLMRLSKPQ